MFVWIHRLAFGLGSQIFCTWLWCSTLSSPVCHRVVGISLFCSQIAHDWWWLSCSTAIFLYFSIENQRHFLHASVHVLVLIRVAIFWLFPSASAIINLIHAQPAISIHRQRLLWPANHFVGIRVESHEFVLRRILIQNFGFVAIIWPLISKFSSVRRWKAQLVHWRILNFPIFFQSLTFIAFYGYLICILVLNTFSLVVFLRNFGLFIFHWQFWLGFVDSSGRCDRLLLLLVRLTVKVGIPCEFCYWFVFILDVEAPAVRLFKRAVIWFLPVILTLPLMLFNIQFRIWIFISLNGSLLTWWFLLLLL